MDVSLDSSDGVYADMIRKALEVLDEHRWQVERAVGARHLLEKFLETVKQARRRVNGEPVYCSCTLMPFIGVYERYQRYINSLTHTS